MSHKWLSLLLFILSTNLISAQTITAQFSCIDHTDIRTLTGNSLSPVVPSGTKLLLLGAYYKCNKPKIGELVLYRWGDNINLAKFIKAKEGDKIEIKKTNTKYTLFINQKPLLNSLGETYTFKEKKKFGVINLFTGVIPKNKVLLLGESIQASYDSKKFGLVDTKYLAGRFIILR